MGREPVLRKSLPVGLIVLLLCSTIPINMETNVLSSETNVKSSSSAVRVQITSPTYIISADEVVTFSAKLYDSVNSEVAGNIIWSATNGLSLIHI